MGYYPNNHYRAEGKQKGFLINDYYHLKVIVLAEPLPKNHEK